jgi:hypothetical protein
MCKTAKFIALGVDQLGDFMRSGLVAMARCGQGARFGLEKFWLSSVELKTSDYVPVNVMWTTKPAASRGPWRAALRRVRSERTMGHLLDWFELAAADAAARRPRRLGRVSL